MTPYALISRPSSSATRRVLAILHLPACSCKTAVLLSRQSFAAPRWLPIPLTLGHARQSPDCSQQVAGFPCLCAANSFVPPLLLRTTRFCSTWTRDPLPCRGSRTAFRALKVRWTSSKTLLWALLVVWPLGAFEGSSSVGPSNDTKRRCVCHGSHRCSSQTCREHRLSGVRSADQ